MFFFSLLYGDHPWTIDDKTKVWYWCDWIGRDPLFQKLLVFIIFLSMVDPEVHFEDTV